jgi:signal transduction histidine kinase
VRHRPAGAFGWTRRRDSERADSAARVTAVGRAGDEGGRASSYLHAVLLASIRRFDVKVVDLVIALALAVAGQASIWAGTTDEGPKAITVPIAIVVTLGLAVRRRSPMAVAAVVAVGWLVQAIAARSPSAVWELIVLLLCAYSLAAHQDRRAAALSGAALLVVIWVVALLDPTQEGSGDLFTAPVLVGLPWLAGRAARRYSAQAHELGSLNAELERRRKEDLLVAARDERARIARELHDIIAHSLSVMVVQAGAAEQVLAHDPERAAEPLAAIRHTGKGALLEMRRLLGVLRTDADGLALAPQPGVRDLPQLVEQMRAAGLDATLTVERVAPPLAIGADLAAYRIVQEALTNVLKHAGKVAVDVHVRVADGMLDIDVTDRGGPPRSRANGAGHGLVGMHERAALYGGSVTAGPTDASGWRVRARLPVAPEAGA